MRSMFFLLRGVRLNIVALSVIGLLASFSFAQDANSKEREYPVAMLAAKTALQQLGAYTGSRLPTLDGFIKTEGIKLDQYLRPYYEFKIDLIPNAPDRTTVRIAAKVSAWYSGAAEPPGYKILETNGRLEDDMLDRLAESLQKNGPPVVEPSALSNQISEARRQRLEVEQRISAMEQRANNQEAVTPLDSPEFASVIKSDVPVANAPGAKNKALLRAQLEDEFEILERRGAWLQVKLDDGRTGWMQQSSVHSSKAVPANERNQGPAVPRGLDAFTIQRENAQPFSGDWIGLKDKRARYIFVRPVGSSINSSPVNKLRFAQSMFSERGREALHNSHNTLDGVVIVFLDQGGGVAAATLKNVRLWLSGNLSSAAFLKTCSLDPPSQFAAPPHPSRTSN